MTGKEFAPCKEFAQPLRNGNWVICYNHSPSPHFKHINEVPAQITDVSIDGALSYRPISKVGGHLYVKYFPITEEILLKAGFKHTGYDRKENKLYTKYAPEMKFVLKQIGDYFFFDDREICEVHDLQNGYYWHAGEELTITL